MNVLHLTPTLGAGGAERQMYLLCRQTSDIVTHTVVAAAAEGRWAGPLRELGLSVGCLETGLRDPRLLVRLRRRIRSAAPDLVHCWLPSMNIAGALAAWPGTPVIASVRNVDDWKPLAYRIADRLMAPLWAAVICNSVAGAEQLLRTVPALQSRVHVVPNGIEAPGAAMPARVAGVERDVAVACRLVPQKRVDRVLEVARRLPGFRFRIAGEGPERSRLEAAAPANVEFLGALAGTAGLLARSGLFLLTSEREGMSNALLEAMQAGCVPVVTPAGDNARIVVHGESGLVAADAAGLAAGLEQAAARWESMSEKARAAVARYQVPAMADRTLQVYRGVVTHAFTQTDPLPRLH